MEAPVIAALIASGAALAAALITWTNGKKAIDASISNVRATIDSSAGLAEKTLAASSVATEKTIRANVVSTNRQRWIDAIRDDFAEFLSAHEVALAYHGSGGTNPGLATEAQTARRKMYHLQSRIGLRLNPDEKEHADFLRLVGELREMDTPWEEAETKAVRAAQDIFKAEWVRIKRGE